MTDGEPIIVDRPSPGRGYLAVLFALTTITLAVAGGFAFTARDDGRPEQFAVWFLFALPLVALVLVPLHAAYFTRYEVRDELHLSAGFVIRARLRFDQIEAVDSVGFIPRVLGWGGGRGLANRFTNGLRIQLRSGAIYYVSPSVPEDFADVLRRRLDHEAVGPT